MKSSKRANALYRCQLTCAIGKKACEGKDIPAGVDRQTWINYQLFAAIEEIATALASKP